MDLKREFAMWGILATAAVLLLGGVLVWQQKLAARRPMTYVQPRPLEGGAIFAEKGCAICHGSDAQGGTAPSLRGRESLSRLPQLVTAMWNHAPKMWQAIDEQKVAYPEMDYAETGQLVAYLYFSRYADASGDPERGKRLFDSKGCSKCHSLKQESGNSEVDLVPAAAVDPSTNLRVQNFDNPIVWTQVMWNHAARMQAALQQQRLQWPHFDANEMRDIAAYVRVQSGNKDGEFSFPASDPDEGWKVFQRKGCMNCHSLAQGVASTGPQLGDGHPLPTSFSEFGAVMLNHFPNMQQAMRDGGQQVPTFERREMSDLVGFIYSLHYVEPSGVAPVGESVFNWRGCGRCHGEMGEGSRGGPPLRGRGQAYTATRLAADLWRHGSRMYKLNQKTNQPWPMLEESDIGNLLAFLNSPFQN